MYLNWIHPLHHLPSYSLPPLPRTISTGFIVLFSYTFTKYMNCKVLPNKDHATCGKERFIGTRPPDCHSFVFRVQRLGWKWVVGFIGGAKPWGRERVSGLQLSGITRWNRSTCLASWVTGSSWGVLQAEKQSGRETSRGEASGHKSGGLVSVLARDLPPAPRMPGT
jgi:hypothetical protein